MRVSGAVRGAADALRARLRLRPEHVALRRAGVRGRVPRRPVRPRRRRRLRPRGVRPRQVLLARRLRRRRARDLPRARAARRRLRRPLRERDDRRARRRARSRRASTGSSSSARRRATSTTTATSAASRREDIDGLLESLESNYLGWSAAMAPVIMGNADRPELGEELTNSLLPHRPRDRAAVRARHLPLRQPRRPRARRRPGARPAVPRRRDRAARGGRVRRSASCRSASSSLLDATGHCPNLSAPEETIAAIKTVPRAG